ncbi:MAG: exosortase family protein XrtF [Bacteroidota bacterium]
MKQLRHTFRFLFIFLALYLVLNLIYSAWITSLGTQPDPLTRWVSVQTSWLLNRFGEATTVQNHFTRPTVSIIAEETVVLSVFEGCNGVNVAIVFVSFLAAFGGRVRAMAWFLPGGLLIIHFFNIARVTLLYAVARYHYHYFYYVHKYLFTALLYIVVFALWWIWIEKVSGLSLRSTITHD